MPEYCKETGKIIYATAAKAYQVCKDMNKKYHRRSCKPIKCEWCGHYHVAHKKRVLK